MAELFGTPGDDNIVGTLESDNIFGVKGKILCEETQVSQDF